MARLVMLPGTACDARLYDAQRAAFPEMVVVEWLAPIRGESLGEYARRLAGAVAFPDDMVLGGLSLGSMVAQELATILRPRKLLLIATARDRRVLRRARVLSPVIQVWPEWLLHGRGIAACAKWGSRARGVGADGSALIADMFSQARPGHIKWAMRAISAWTPPVTLPCPVAMLHGRLDSTLPHPGAMADLTTIEDGGHLINLTHAGQVNAWMAREAG